MPHKSLIYFVKFIYFSNFTDFFFCSTFLILISRTLITVFTAFEAISKTKVQSQTGQRSQTTPYLGAGLQLQGLPQHLHGFFIFTLVRQELEVDTSENM